MQKQTLPSEQLLDLQTKTSELQDIQRQIKEKEKVLKEAKNDHAELLSGKLGASHAELALSKQVRARTTTIDKLIRDFRDSANSLQTSLESYDSLMKMTDRYASDQVNIYIGAKNQNLLNASKNQFWVVNSYVSKLNDLYFDFSRKEIGKITENELLSAYAIYKKLGEEMIQWGRTNYDMFLESIETAGSSATCLKYSTPAAGEEPKCLQWSQDSLSFTRSDMMNYAKTLGTAMETAGYGYLDKYRATVETLAGLKDSDTTIEDAADKVERLRIELEKLKIQLQKQTFELEVTKKKTSLDTAELDKKIEDARIDLEKAKS